MKTYRTLLRLQGIFYFLTGIWPLLHIKSFMLVTGPKYDLWLVKTVGLLIVAVSVGLLAASFRKYVQPDVILTGVSCALFLAGVDVYYTLNDRIAPVYLADAVAEALIIAAWAFWYLRLRPEEKGENFVK